MKFVIILAMKKRYKFIHETKDKIRGQNITQRRYKMHNYMPHMYNIGPYEVCNLCIDSLGNTN